MYSYEVNYTYTIHFRSKTIHRTFTFVIYHWKSLKNIHYWLQKRKKIKILTGIETCLVSWVAGGVPSLLSSKEGEKPRFVLILFILYL